MLLSYEYLCLIYERVEKISINNKVYYICLADKLDTTGFIGLGFILKMVYTSRNNMLDDEQLRSGMLGKIDVYDSEFNQLLSTDEAVALYKNDRNSLIPIMLAGLGVSKECYAFNIHGDFLYSKYDFASIEDIRMGNIVSCITKDGKRVLYDLNSDAILINDDIIGIYQLSQNPDNVSDLEKHFNVKLDVENIAPKIVDYSTIIIETKDGLYEVRFDVRNSYHRAIPTLSMLGLVYSLKDIHKIDNIKTYLSDNGSRINMGLLSIMIFNQNMYRYRLRGNILDDLGYVDASAMSGLTAKQYVMRKLHGDNFRDFMIGS